MEAFETRLERVRTKLVIHHPFIASLLFGLDKELDDSMPFMAAVSTKSLFLNPKRIEENGITNHELMGILAHEALHPALFHLQRKGSRNTKIWNIAADAVVNHFVSVMGLTLPKFVVKAIPGKDTEAIYAELIEDAEECPSCGNMQAGNADGNSKTCPNCEGEPNPQFDEHKFSLPGEEENDQRVWETKITAAADTARNFGKLPKELEVVLEKLSKPVVDWRTELATWMQIHSGDEDYRWVPPKKNRMHLGYLPSSYSEKCECIIGVDTSGSMSDEELIWAVSEITELVTRFTAETVKVITFDTQIHDEFEVYDAHSVRDLKMRGRGGTNFCPFFERVADIGADVIIVFTDTMGPFPNDPPGQPTIFAGMYARAEPPWGARYIFVDSAAEIR